MFGNHEFGYFSEALSINSGTLEERLLIANGQTIQYLLCYADTEEDYKRLSDAIGAFLSHPMSDHVFTKGGDWWRPEAVVAAAFVARIAHLFHFGWESSFDPTKMQLPPDVSNKICDLHERVQHWQRNASDMLSCVGDRWHPLSSFVVDASVVYAVWALTEMGIGKIEVYRKIFHLLGYTSAFGIVVMACACLTSRANPCTFELIAPSDYEQFSRCHELLRRFTEIAVEPE